MTPRLDCLMPIKNVIVEAVSLDVEQTNWETSKEIFAYLTVRTIDSRCDFSSARMVIINGDNCWLSRY